VKESEIVGPDPSQQVVGVTFRIAFPVSAEGGTALEGTGMFLHKGSEFGLAQRLLEEPPDVRFLQDVGLEIQPVAHRSRDGVVLRSQLVPQCPVFFHHASFHHLNFEKFDGIGLGVLTTSRASGPSNVVPCGGFTCIALGTLSAFLVTALFSGLAKFLCLMFLEYNFVICRV